MKTAGLAEIGIALMALCNSAILSSGADGQDGVAAGPWNAPAQAAGKQNPVPANETSIAEGKALYQKDCLSCHGATGKGDGPKADTLKVQPRDLTDPKMRQQADGVLFWKITEGRTPMPSFRTKYSASQLWALVNYVRTLSPRDGTGRSGETKPAAEQAAPESGKTQSETKQAGAQAKQGNVGQKAQAWTAPDLVAHRKNPVAANRDSIVEGKELYQEECLTCHGAAGIGDGREAQTLPVSPADLSNPRMWQQSDGALFWKINEGKSPMPAFRLRFSRREVWTLVNYVRTLAPKDVAGHALASDSQGHPNTPSREKWQGGTEQAAAEGSGSDSNQSPQALLADQSPSKEKLTAPQRQAANGTKNKAQALVQPEYLHVLINPIPIYGLATAVLVLAIGLVLRSRLVQLLGLGLVVFSAASAWPTYVLGEKAYSRVYTTTDGDGQHWMDTHKHRAEKLVIFFYALAAVALSAALVPLKVPKTALPLALLTLLMALASLGAGAWIAKAGGKVRHPEFRTESLQGRTVPETTR